MDAALEQSTKARLRRGGERWEIGPTVYVGGDSAFLKAHVYYHVNMSRGSESSNAMVLS